MVGRLTRSRTREVSETPGRCRGHTTLPASLGGATGGACIDAIFVGALVAVAAPVAR